MASKLGRTYRITRRSLERLLAATSARADITLRDYSNEEITAFLESDQLDPDAEQVRQRFLEANRLAGRA